MRLLSTAQIEGKTYLEGVSEDSSLVNFLVRDQLTGEVKRRTLVASGITSTQVSNWDNAYGWGNHALAGYALTTYVDAQIASLIDSSPGTLDTLNELAAALGDDPNFATTVTNSIAGKVSLTAAETISGAKTFTAEVKISTSARGLILQDSNGDATTSSPYMEFQQSNNTRLGYIGYGSSGSSTLTVRNDNGSINFNTASGSVMVNGEEIASKTWVLAQEYIKGSYLQSQATSNADAMDTTGVLFNYLSSNATNKPAGTVDGALTSLSYSGYWTFQTYGDWRENKLWTRVQTHASWSSWVSLWSSGDFTLTDVSNWDNAYGWGNHASAGYLTAVPSAYKVQTWRWTVNGNASDPNDVLNKGQVYEVPDINFILNASSSVTWSVSGGSPRPQLAAVNTPTDGKLYSYGSTAGSWVNNTGVASAVVTGTGTKTLTLTLQDGTTVTASWTDIIGTGGTADGNDYVNSMNFDDTTGILTLTRTDTGTVSDSLDGRYALISSLSSYATQAYVTSQGYITSAALTGYATEAWVNGQGFLTSYTETDPYGVQAVAVETLSSTTKRVNIQLRNNTWIYSAAFTDNTSSGGGGGTMSNFSLYGDTNVSGGVIVEQGEVITLRGLTGGAIETVSGATGNTVTFDVKASGINSTRLASNAVTTAKIADLSVTSDKLASASVTTAKIADLSVTSDKIAGNAVTQSQLAANSVGGAELQDASVKGTHFAGTAFTSGDVGKIPQIKNVNGEFEWVTPSSGGGSSYTPVAFGFATDQTAFTLSGNTTVTGMSQFMSGTTGSVWNSSTGTYTAQFTGVYEISYNVNIIHNGSTALLIVSAIHVNGTESGYSKSLTSFGTSGALEYSSCQWTGYISLTANDTVQLRLTNVLTTQQIKILNGTSLFIRRIS